MGFFGALGKIIAGKPVYPMDNGQQVQQTGSPAQPMQPQSQTPLSALSSPTFQKDIPQLRLERIENLMQSGQYELYIDIANESREPVFLDNVALLGTRKELDSQLRPGEKRQYLLYRGRPFTNPLHQEIQLRYRKQADGDYFLAYFELRSRRETDGFFKATECRQIGPVKDI